MAAFWYVNMDIKTETEPRSECTVILLASERAVPWEINLKLLEFLFLG